MPRKLLTSLAIIGALVLVPAGVVLTAAPALADTLTSTTVVPNSVFGVAISPDGSTVYASDFGSAQVSVLSASTGAIIRSIALPAQPFGLTLSPDGTRLYVALAQANQVAILDAATGVSLGTITSAGFPKVVQFAPNGTDLWILNSNNATAAVYDTVAGVLSAAIPTIGAQDSFAMSADGATAYAVGQAGVAIIDTATRTRTSTLSLAGNLTSARVTTDGASIWVGSRNSAIYVISTATNTVSSTVPAAGDVYDIAFSPDGATAYALNQPANQLTVITVATGAAAPGLMVATDPRFLAISLDGGMLAVGSNASKSVSLVALTPTFVATTPAAGTVGSAYSYRVRAPGTLAVTAGTLPAGLSIVGSTIAGTPTAVGASTFTITATNAAGSGSRTLTITVGAAAVAVPVGAGAGAGAGVDPALAATGADLGFAPYLAAVLLLLGTGGVLFGRTRRRVVRG